MTSQEEQMINSLVERVNATQLSEKDPEAADTLKRGFASNPDAVYILAQSVLVQNIALEQARAQLAEAQQQLQQQAQQPAKSGSFLGNLLGHRDPQPAPPAFGYQQVYNPQAQPEYQTPYYPNQPYPGQPQYGGQPQYVVAPPGQPSFLRSAAQTAAGVAAGALVFEGVESMLHGGFGHPGFGMGGFGGPGLGFGGGGFGGGYERPIEENVVNNYYDSPEPEHHHESSSSWDDGGSGQGGGWDSGSGGDDSGSFDSGGSGNDDGGF